MDGEVLVEETPRLALVGYIDAVVSGQKQRRAGVGIHGYIVTDKEVKRGYGLKNIIPSRLGYVVGEKTDLREVAEVFDIFSCPAVGEGRYASVVEGLIDAASSVLELALDKGTTEVYLGLSRPQLATQLSSGLSNIRQRDYRNGEGIPYPYIDQLRRYVRIFDTLTEQKVTVTVACVEVTDMGYIEANINAQSGELHALKVKQEPETEETLSSFVVPEGYWNHNHGRHELLKHQRLLYWSNGKFESLPEYLYTMDYKKDNDPHKRAEKIEIEVGQLLADARYAVVKPHRIDPLLNKIAQTHSSLHKEGHSNLAVLYLGAIYSSNGHAKLERFGTDYLVNRTFLTELKSGDGTMFTHDIPIPRRSRRAAAVYLKLEDVLKTFEGCHDKLEGKPFDCSIGRLVATDITDIVQETIEGNKGKLTFKPNKCIELPNVTLTVNSGYVTDDSPETIKHQDVKLSIGYDTPTRNVMASLMGEGFKAYVLTYQDTNLTLRPMTVIISKQGNGIWATPFGARTFIKTQ